MRAGWAPRGDGRPGRPGAQAGPARRQPSPADLEYLNVHQHWMVATWRGTPVVVFDDERAVLTALWEAGQLGWLPGKATLVRLDAHHDQWPLATAGQASWLEAVRSGSRREVLASVEFDIGCDDADWVRAAAAAGMVRDVVTFYVTECPEPPPLPGIRSVQLGGLGAELDPGGRLCPAGRAGIPQVIPDVPGWDAVACRFGSAGLPYVLSVDLDAFTSCDERGRPVAWPREQMVREFHAPRRCGGGPARVADVLRGLARDAALVTIAREPEYCGGDRAAADLLRVLDDEIFGGALHPG